MKKQTLNGLWNMKECGKEVSYETTIPGSVLSGLLENHVIEDPFYRDNEFAARDLFWKDYEFTRTFFAGEDILSEKYIELVCFGLDTLTEIYLNGTHVADTNNMHRTYRFFVKDLLVKGENTLRIVCKSTLQYIADYKPEEQKEIHAVNHGSIFGNHLIRKAHSMFGWDWGPQLPDAGIFRDMELQAYSEGKIKEVRIRQLHETNRVTLTVTSALQKVNGDETEIQILVKDPEGKVLCREKQEVKRENACQEIIIENPQLWWPNGVGKQPLYQVQITLYCKEKEEDFREYTIGLRTITVSQEKDEWGSEFAFCVNGVKLFAKGANYIPEDCVYNRITNTVQEYLIKSCIKANYNCLRVWGGGYYPSDYFYELCDKNGILVWQDLMFACNVYDMTEELTDTIVEEVKDNVERLRHHASLALWCGNNEIETAWDNWEIFQTESHALKADYIKLFEYVIPRTVKEKDDTTFYWLSSPSTGGSFLDPENENAGDSHYWKVWHGLLPFEAYREHYFRFCSEFGFQSFPSMKTVESFTALEDRNIFTKVMEDHQKNKSANGKILYYLAENFCYPKDFESLLYVSQIMQAVAMKTGVEHFRRSRGRCMGALYWQVNDNWPVASWSGIDYYGRWKALHYLAKKFYAPIAPSLVCTGKDTGAFVQNETLQDVTVEAVLSLKTTDFKVLQQKKLTKTIPALSVEALEKMDFNSWITMAEKEGIEKNSMFVELQVTQPDGSVQTETEVFLPYKYMKLQKPSMEVRVAENGDSYDIFLTCDTFANYVELDFSDADVIFSDNYFALTGKEEKRIQLEKADIQRGSFVNAEDVKKRLQIRSIRDSYEF